MFDNPQKLGKSPCDIGYLGVSEVECLDFTMLYVQLRPNLFPLNTRRGYNGKILPLNHFNKFAEKNLLSLHNYQHKPLVIMAKTFSVNQFPGVSLEFRVSFNTRIPTTVLIFREDDLFQSVSSIRGRNSQVIQTGQNNAITMNYRIECSTRRGAAEGKVLSKSNDVVEFGFDDRDVADGDFDDAIVEVTFLS